MNKLTYVVTFHSRRYLYECLMSLAVQSDQSYDLVLLADTCKDQGIVQYCNDFTKYLSLPTNTKLYTVVSGAPGTSRNYAIDLATTEWVSYIDGDDYIMPHTTSVILDALGKIDPLVNFISSASGSVNTRGEYKVDIPSLTYMPSAELYSDRPWHELDPYIAQLQVFKKSSWAKYKYLEGHVLGEDEDFALHQLLLGKYYRITEPLYAYRITRSGASHDKSFPNMYDERRLKGYYSNLFANRDQSISFI